MGNGVDCSKLYLNSLLMTRPDCPIDLGITVCAEQFLLSSGTSLTEVDGFQKPERRFAIGLLQWV